MIKSKVFEILKTFSREELKRFSDFILSPYFNKKDLIIKLYCVYQNYHPNFDDDNFTKENVFYQLFPDKGYNDEVFRNLNSDLYKLTEEFLAYQNILKDPFILKRHLLSEINSRKILPIFEKNFIEAKKMLDISPYRNIDYFSKNYLLYSEKDLYNTIRNNFLKEDILEAGKCLLKSFLISIFENNSYILYTCRKLNLDSHLFIKNNLIYEFTKKIPSEISRMPQLLIQYNILKLEETSNIKFYENLKKLLLEHGTLLEKERHYAIYMNMIDFIARTKSLSDLSTTEELFELRKKIVENNLFVVGGHIQYQFFYNLVNAGSRLKKFDWVENFIFNYGKYIEDEYRESTIELSHSILNFAKKNYQISLSHLANVKNENADFMLLIKLNTVKIYYELNEFDLLINYINSYKMFLYTNQTLTQYRISAHSKFISIVQGLAKIKESKKYQRLEKVNKEINAVDDIYKIWLLEKTTELEKLYFES